MIPLDQGPYAFVWVDALTQKAREGGRIIHVHALIAVVNAKGHRDILGLDVATSEDGAGWLAFLRSLVARGLSGVHWSSPTPTPAWSTPSPHALRAEFLLRQVPKSAQPWVATLLRTVFEQPDAVKAQMRHVLEALEAKFPTAESHLDAAQHDLLAFTVFPRELVGESAQAFWCDCLHGTPPGIQRRLPEAHRLRGGCRTSTAVGRITSSNRFGEPSIGNTGQQSPGLEEIRTFRGARKNAVEGVDRHSASSYVHFMRTGSTTGSRSKSHPLPLAAGEYSLH